MRQSPSPHAATFVALGPPSMPKTFVPYCGLPPVPAELHANLDPALLLIFAAAGAVYWAGAAQDPEIGHREKLLFGAGLLLTVGALVSPLCHLSVALFSARVSQHMLLTLIAAPLLVLGRPERALWAMLDRWGFASNRRPHHRRHSLAVGSLLFASLMWFWHLPSPYDATLQSNVIYWLMHATLMASALILWHGLLVASRGAPGRAALLGFATGMQMSLLGAILTFAATPLFEVHATSTGPWGLSQLEDQMLGGLIMWIPAGLLFTVYAAGGIVVMLNRSAIASLKPVRPGY